MIVQRVGVSALRQGAIRPAFMQNVPKMVTVSTTSRSITTEKMTSTDESSLLASQRLARPLSPHLGIYKKNQTWFGASILNRATGGLLSGTLYVYASLYAVSPLLGWHLESASVAAAFATLPFVAKALIKFVYAWPLVFHSINGIRHLGWDLTMGFSRAQIKKSDSAIIAASVLAALGLAFLV